MQFADVENQYPGWVKYARPVHEKFVRMDQNHEFIVVDHVLKVVVTDPIGELSVGIMADFNANVLVATGVTCSDCGGFARGDCDSCFNVRFANALSRGI